MKTRPKNYNRTSAVFFKSVIITACSLALIVIGFIGMGYLIGYFS